MIESLNDAAPANEPSSTAGEALISTNENEALLAEEITVLGRCTDLDTLTFTTNWMIDV